MVLFNLKFRGAIELHRYRWLNFRGIEMTEIGDCDILQNHLRLFGLLRYSNWEPCVAGIEVIEEDICIFVGPVASEDPFVESGIGGNVDIFGSFDEREINII